MRGETVSRWQHTLGHTKKKQIFPSKRPDPGARHEIPGGKESSRLHSKWTATQNSSVKKTNECSGAGERCSERNVGARKSENRGIDGNTTKRTNQLLLGHVILYEGNFI